MRAQRDVERGFAAGSYKDAVAGAFKNFYENLKVYRTVVRDEDGCRIRWMNQRDASRCAVRIRGLALRLPGHFLCELEESRKVKC